MDNIDGRHYYTIHEAAKELNLSEATIRRRIKIGKMKAELISGYYGKEYRIPIESVYPSNVVIETKTIEVAHTLTEAEIKDMFTNTLTDYCNGLETKLDTLESTWADNADKLTTLLTICAENNDKLTTVLAKKQEKLPWWRRIIKGGGK